MPGQATGRGQRRELFVAARNVQRHWVCSLEENATRREQIPWRCVAHAAKVAIQWKRTWDLVW